MCIGSDGHGVARRINAFPKVRSFYDSAVMVITIVLQKVYK